jgi:iron complex outermembrane recepter protein
MAKGVRTVQGSHLLATSAILVVLMATALPLRAQGQAGEPQVGQASQRSFNIPPQPLSSALPLFGQQSGRQITADAALVRGINTPGVQGTMTIEEALQRLLAGTGLTFSGIAGDTIALQRTAQGGQLPSGVMQLDPVQVQGYPVPAQAMIDNIPPPYAGGQVAKGGQLGLLGNRDVMDTPFNQSSYTAKKAQDQQAKTVRDVLVDDPSVRFFRADTGLGDNGMYVRGFPVNNSDFAYGGLYGLLPTASTMMELAERVEVLKGPSAMLNGMAPTGAIGGTINVVPKRAPDEPLTQLTANYTSSAQFGGHADIARRFGSEKQFGVRFNGVYGNGQTDVRYNTNERALAVFGLDYRGERFRVSADLGYQYQNIGGVVPYLGVANGVPLPWAPNARNNPGGQPWGQIVRKDLFGVARAEFDLTERITAFASFGAHDFRFSGLYSGSIVATNFYGAATTTTDLPSNQQQFRTYLSGEAGIRGFADTGIISHEFALIGSNYYQDFGTGRVNGTGFATNFYNPTIIARPDIPTPNTTKTGNITLTSLSIADTLSAADKRIQLTVGGRLQQVQSSNFNNITGALTSGYSESALSPSAALVFKPWSNVSIYGNFIQGLQQGAIVGPTFANAGEVFAPYKSTQYEAGVKVDWGKLTTTASVFQISQPSILTNVATNTQFVGGEQRNQGLELNFFGEVTKGFRVLGGAMFLSAVLTKTAGGATDGWIAPFSPSAQFNLAAEVDLPFVPGLTLMGRTIYTGAQFFDTTAPRRSLPEWTRFDVGVRYAFENPGARGKLLVARLNVDNLLDNNYWGGGNGPTNLVLGMPRTFRLSLTADF